MQEYSTLNNICLEYTHQLAGTEYYRYFINVLTDIDFT